MKRIKQKIFDSVVAKIFEKQLVNDYHIAWLDGFNAQAEQIDKIIDYWEHWSGKTLLNQSKQILKEFKRALGQE